MNLTPEQRPDRNGNVVTRWVKRLSEHSDVSADIPKPTIPADESQRQLKDNLEAEIEARIKEATSRIQEAEDFRAAVEELETVEDARSCADAYDDSRPITIDKAALEAFKSFRKVASSQGMTVEGRVAPSLQHAAGHLIANPEDGLLLESILRRGVNDSDTALSILYEAKEESVPDALTDGFL